MAYYGIPSAAASLTATNSNDTISVLGRGTTTLTAQSINGADGNDIISLAAIGRTAVASATLSAASGQGNSESGAYDLKTIANLPGLSASYASLTGLVTASASISTSVSVHITGVLTAEQATRTANSIYLQGNAGNDTIALGDELVLASASTFAGGQGNDYIIGATNVNDVWAGTGTSLDGTTFNSVDIEGGLGNDTIILNGAAYFSAVSLNANQGNDVVNIRSATLNQSLLGLGAGNDGYSGIATGATNSTLAGGKGNDIISLSFKTTSRTMSGNTFAGDRANNVVLDADGNDSIYIAITAGSTLASGTIYGGGGNDSIQIAGSGVSNALFVQTNAGADVFTAISAGDIKSSFIGMGAAGDIVDFAKSADILNSDIHLGKGADSIYFNGADMASGASFSGTTIYGGAGADLLASEGIVATNKTVVTTFEYNAASDSTIDAFDTIAVMSTGGSASYSLLYNVGGVSQAVFSSVGATATNGLVAFSSTFDNAVTARVSKLASNTVVGDAAVFYDGAGVAYLFVNGSTDDLVVQIGSTAGDSGQQTDSTLTINNDGKNMTINLL